GGGRRAPVCVCDGGDDCEPKAHPRGAAGPVATAEPLESPIQELGRKTLSLVGDAYHDLATGHGCFETNVACAVAECVLDEVGERLLESSPVDQRGEVVRSFDLDRASGVFAAPVKARGDRVEQVVDR